MAFAVALGVGTTGYAAAPSSEASPKEQAQAMKGTIQGEVALF